MIRVDYHFHPNLPLFSKKLANWKAKRIWQSFGENKLDIVFITEHVYKSPRTSYGFLLANRPASAKTHIVPGLEYISKEGVDMIVFSKYPNQIYSKEKLLTPYYFTTEELINYVVSHTDLYGIVTHPYAFGSISIVKTHGRELTLKAVGSLGFLEKYNYSWGPAVNLIEKSGLGKVFPEKYRRISRAKKAPKYLEKKAKTLTVGSDAHHTLGIGDCAEIEAKHKDNYNYLFDAALSKTGKPYERVNKPAYLSLLGGLTSVVEVVVKKLKLYSIDQPYTTDSG